MISIKEAKRIGEVAKYQAVLASLSGNDFAQAQARKVLDELFPELLRIIELQHKLLKRREWEADQEIGAPWCPECGANKKQGHAPDCELAAALKEVGE